MKNETEITAEQRQRVREGLVVQFTRKSGEAPEPVALDASLNPLGVAKGHPDAARSVAEQMEYFLFLATQREDAGQAALARSYYLEEVDWESHRDLMGLFRTLPYPEGWTCLLFCWDPVVRERSARQVEGVERGFTLGQELGSTFYLACRLQGDPTQGAVTPIQCQKEAA